MCVHILLPASTDRRGICVPINLYLPAETKSDAKKAEAPALDNWREPPGMLGVYVRRVKKQAGQLPLNSQRSTK